MTLEHSGKLLIRVSGQAYNSLQPGTGILNVPNYHLEPLFKAYQRTPAFSPGQLRDHWFLAAQLAFDEDNPWDIAHRIAGSAGYAFYAEPDLLQNLRAAAPVRPTEGLDPNWPPCAPVSPGWHLLPDYTDFKSAPTQGAGVRIAHLDTGYSSIHKSRPKNLKPRLGWNFYEGNSNTIDPGIAVGWPPPFPGHGAATLALCAGAKFPGGMIYGGHLFNQAMGGAPESDVIPVRIGASVIHFYTSAMAQGIDYALAPVCDPVNKCDVITLSHGGYPSQAWADAVNNVYDAGIVLAAASGDHVIIAGVDIPGHTTIWPSYFRRAITVTGATYDKTPYATDQWGVLQGSWGPDNIMDKAIASYTPNVASMKFDTRVGYNMNGGGTSASTPQVAAACALWVAQNHAKFPPDWRRVQACRYALFSGAYKGSNSRDVDPYLGNGILNVPAMLAVVVDPSKLHMEDPDTVTSELWRSVMNLGPSTTNEGLMYEVEAAQIVCRSRNSEIRQADRDLKRGTLVSETNLQRLRRLLDGEPDVSATLQRRLSSTP